MDRMRQSEKNAKENGAEASKLVVRLKEKLLCSENVADGGAVKSNRVMGTKSATFIKKKKKKCKPGRTEQTALEGKRHAGPRRRGTWAGQRCRNG